MQKFLSKFFLGFDILLNAEEEKIQRNKTVDTKKELRIAKTIRKTSIAQRSANRIKF